MLGVRSLVIPVFIEEETGPERLHTRYHTVSGGVRKSGSTAQGFSCCVPPPMDKDKRMWRKGEHLRRIGSAISRKASLVCQEAEQSTERTRTVCIRPLKSSFVHCSSSGSEWADEELEAARVDCCEK